MDYRNIVFRMALRLGPPLLVLISFIALVIGSILHAVYINELEYNTPSDRQFNNDVLIKNETGDLVWFMQITDLHINVMSPDREKDFEEFASTYIDIVKPQAVLVTGDITDGRIPGTTLGTGPQLHDWSTYSNIIFDKTNAARKTLWLDIRGNHDNFNVYNPQSPANLYRKHSVQGKTYPRNQFNLLNKNGKNYTFIGVDEIQTPGLKIPFNFLGVVDSEDIRELSLYKQLSHDYHSQYTIWYAHYPTSSVESRITNLKEMIDGPYLCGHFHTIGSWVPNMYANQQQGYTEAELGDWKYNRYLRIAAIDHQLFSFVDFNFREWPVALMTNPKNAGNRMPKYEPLNRISKSTHIRVLAFSNVSIISVEVSLAGQEFEAMNHSEGPLYVLQWEPDRYSTGIVSAIIKVKDQSGATRTFMQTFSLDNPMGPESSFLARMFLRTRFRFFMMSIFLFLVTLCVLPALVMNLVAVDGENSCMYLYYRDTLMFSFYMSAKINKIVYPLLFIPIYLAAGPHFVGELVDGLYGVGFAWGALIEGRFVYTAITYNASSLFLLLIHIPVSMLIITEVGDRYKRLMQPDAGCYSYRLKLLVHGFCTFLQLGFGYILGCAYGTLGFLSSFPFLWSQFIYLYCWFRVRNLTRSDFIVFRKDDMSNPQQEQLLTSRQRTGNVSSSTSEDAGISA